MAQYDSVCKIMVAKQLTLSKFLDANAVMDQIKRNMPVGTTSHINSSTIVFLPLSGQNGS